MTLANFLTLFRLFLCPFFLLFYLYPDAFFLTPVTMPFALLAVLLISESTDAADGFVARRFGQVTDFGKLLDPMADSITRISAFLAFTQPPVNLPVVLVFLFIYRDSVVSTLRTVCALKGFALAARTSGKIKAALQAVAIFFIVILLIPFGRGEMDAATLTTWATVITTLTALYAVYTGIEYVFVNRRYMTLK